jgi:electron transfer flavoprotein alpha subunit
MTPSGAGGPAARKAPGSAVGSTNYYADVVLKEAEVAENFEDWRGIWVIVEHREGTVRDVTFELLGAARPMADKLNVDVTAVLLCDKPGSMPDAISAAGADKVIVVEHSWLKTSLARPSADVLTELINDRKPEIVLIGATHTGRDISSRIAVTVEAGMTADCTELDVEEHSRELLARRPAWGGKMLATIRCDRHRPQMATARPGIFMPLAKRAVKAQPDKVKFAWLDKKQYHAEVLDYLVENTVDITKEDVLVGGGMGVGPDGWGKLEELAKALGGEVACTRPVADAGWQERGRQIGQTGLSVRPKLYIAVGISGAIQHIEGMKEAGTVIAINIDPTSQIFEYADIGLVGDWKGHVDALISAAKEKGLDKVTWKYPSSDTLADDRAAAAKRAGVEAPTEAVAPAAPAKPAAKTPAKDAPAAPTVAAKEDASAETPAVVPEPTPEPVAPVASEEYEGDPMDRDAVIAWVKDNVKEETKAWVLSDDCIVCSGCDAACPTGAAITTDVARVDRDICISDGACFDACPTDAIRPGLEVPGQTAGWPEGSRLAK